MKNKERYKQALGAIADKMGIDFENDFAGIEGDLQRYSVKLGQGDGNLPPRRPPVEIEIIHDKDDAVKPSSGNPED